MQRQRGELVPIAKAFSDLSGPVAVLRDASPQARHHFTLADQVNQLVGASEADPDLGSFLLSKGSVLSSLGLELPARPPLKNPPDSAPQTGSEKRVARNVE